MIFDCPACAAALRFRPALGKLECISCGNTYEVSEFADKKEASQSSFSGENDTMECNIYTCTSCGAELAVNGVESSTFCSYCGQPTIVFSRVSSALKPKHIIPFSVSKEQAITAIRSHISKGFFVPNEIKNFEIERVRGIYLPFWLYDIDYSDCQYLSGQVKQGKHTVTKYFYREAECTFHDMTLDASRQLSDESSQRLEPYNTSVLKPFETGYLSGFYADCYDMKSEQLTPLAISRAKSLFDGEVAKTVRASNIQILNNNAKYEIRKSEYTMFPAWFLTFRYQNEPYTILVNGQTCKVIGAVPYTKARITVLFTFLGLLASCLFSFLLYCILPNLEKPGKLIILLFIGAFAMFSHGSRTIQKVKQSIALSKSSIMNQFVKKRQEGE